jgi:hypothetical protein
MARQHAEASGHRVRLALATLGFLCLVFLIPPPSYLGGRSFVEVARASEWHQWGDWLAAWCSLRIVLLNLALFGLVVLVIIVLTLWERVNLARILLLATIVPGAGVLMGFYYLVKALL